MGLISQNNIQNNARFSACFSLKDTGFRSYFCNLYRKTTIFLSHFVLILWRLINMSKNSFRCTPLYILTHPRPLPCMCFKRVFFRRISMVQNDSILQKSAHISITSNYSLIHFSISCFTSSQNM